MGSAGWIFERRRAEKWVGRNGFVKAAIGLSLDRPPNLPHGPPLKRGGPMGPLFFFTRFTGL
ncbi:hypothetical protein ATN00_03005 [Sphingobium baderi]|jgi:hypothetical protein|uniref:Uncharacterized protein n=1 Tax=Sphingobium baderi TaxID=1332080 RepID=A0A0S3EVH6_9SPHN|nr:hypothetical protein ATN00_03005 [Sphingobium baderi]